MVPGLINALIAALAIAAGLYFWNLAPRQSEAERALAVRACMDARLELDRLRRGVSEEPNLVEAPRIVARCEADGL